MLRDDLQRFEMLVEGAALAQGTSLEGYATA
jgi:hypothetical protein